MIDKYTSFVMNSGDEIINAILVNGKGGDMNVDLIQLPRAEFVVTKGKRYRFRVINIGVEFCPLEVSIDDHNLTLIATDGNPIEPILVRSFYILAGERVDFVLNAQADVSTYWIKVKGHADCEANSVFQTAILRYNGSNDLNLANQAINYNISGPNQQGIVRILF
jgi:L-ascorbate oxidase